MIDRCRNCVVETNYLDKKRHVRKLRVNITFLWVIRLSQEPITRSVQLLHIPVTAFSRPIFRLTPRPPQQPQWPIKIFNWREGISVFYYVDNKQLAYFMSTINNNIWTFFWTFLTCPPGKRSLKIDWSVKMPWHRLSMGIERS